MSQETTTQIFISNGVEYKNTTYNGFSLLTRTNDNYFNATKLCHEISEREGKHVKEFYNVKESPQFKDYRDLIVSSWSPEIQGTHSPVEVVNGKGVLNEVRGSYVHPQLINCVLTLTSIKYLEIVSHIMDKINEYSQATGQTFNETKDQLIAQLQAKIDEQSQQIQQLETKIAQTSVPEENCDKDLFIIRVKGQLKLCADNTHKPTQFIRRYRFPAAMNVRQMIREQFELTNVNIPNDRLEEVMTFINGLNPKERE